MQHRTVRHKLQLAAAVSTLGLILGAGNALAEQHEAQAQTQQQQGAAQELQPIGVVGFEALDLDSNGTVTQQELETIERLSQQLRQQFDNADANKDGTIDQAEFAQFEQATRGGQMQQDGQMMQDSQMRGGGQMHQDGQMMPQGGQMQQRSPQQSQ